MQSAKELKRDLRELAQSRFPLITFWGFESEDIFLWKNRQYMYCDHAYFDRGYEKGNFRVLFSSVHQTKVRHDLPEDRARKYCPFPRPWRKGSKVIVIPARPMMQRFHEAQDWTEQAIKTLRKHTDREVVIKAKDGPPIADILHDAWAVVCHSSVAGVEAAYLGCPVFGPSASPAYGVGESDLTKIESPRLPDRDAWLRSLSYSQFSLEEIASGKAWSIIREVWLGDKHA